MTDNPLAKLGDLSKPATVLVEKIADAVGGIFKPYQIVRVAKAEVEAERIHAQSQIEITDLHRRAMHRFLEEEAKKQSNIEAITQQAIPLLEDKSKPENVQNDWITNFFDKARIVSDSEMQQLWGRVLAQEANRPGTFSKRTVNLVGDLEKHDALAFAQLCGFAWVIGTAVPLVLDVEAQIYKSAGINFNVLSHLESLGLVHFDNLGGFRRLSLPKKLTTYYYGKPLELSFPNESNNDLSIGKVRLTRAGLELAPICGSTPVDGFFEFVYDRWAQASLVPKKEGGPGPNIRDSHGPSPN